MIVVLVASASTVLCLWALGLESLLLFFAQLCEQGGRVFGFSTQPSLDDQIMHCHQQGIALAHQISKQATASGYVHTKGGPEIHDPVSVVSSIHFN